MRTEAGEKSPMSSHGPRGNVRMPRSRVQKKTADKPGYYHPLWGHSLAEPSGKVSMEGGESRSATQSGWLHKTLRRGEKRKVEAGHANGQSRNESAWGSQAPGLAGKGGPCPRLF